MRKVNRRAKKYTKSRTAIKATMWSSGKFNSRNPNYRKVYKNPYYPKSIRTAETIYQVPVPDKVNVKFRCQDLFPFTITSTSQMNYTAFNINNPRNPNTSSILAASCNGFPAMMAMWRRCLCTSVKVTAHMYLTGGMPCILGFIVFDDHNLWHTVSGNGITRSFIYESPNNVSYQTVNSLSQYQAKPVIVSRYTSIKQLEGEPDLEAQTYSCTATADPTLQPRAYVGFTMPTNTTANMLSSSCWANVIVTYYCTLYERIDLNNAGGLGEEPEQESLTSKMSGVTCTNGF